MVPATNAATGPVAATEPAGQSEVSDGEAIPRAVLVSYTAATPPVALNGYCVVELVKNGHWVKGDLRWTVVHKGFIYRLSGPAQRQQFLADPEAFAPVNLGNDPVLAVEEHRSVPGQAAYCATYNGRLYMFASAATQAQFNQAPQRYAAGK